MNTLLFMPKAVETLTNTSQKHSGQSASRAKDVGLAVFAQFKASVKGLADSFKTAFYQPSSLLQLDNTEIVSVLEKTGLTTEVI